MKQTTQQVAVRILRADADHYITQSDPDLPAERRILTRTVYLGAHDTPDAWREITADEAAEILAAQQAIIDQEAAAPEDVPVEDVDAAEGSITPL